MHMTHDTEDRQWPPQFPVGYSDWSQEQQIDFLTTKNRESLIRLCLAHANVEPKRRVHSKRQLTKEELAAIYRALVREEL